MAHQELPRPEGTDAAAEADEIVRAWLNDGKLQVSVKADAFEDPGAWGIFLADTAKRVARLIATEGQSLEELHGQIVEMFNVIMTPGMEEGEDFTPPAPPVT